MRIVEWNVVAVFCGDVFLDPILEKLEMMTKSRIHNPIGPRLNVLGLGKILPLSREIFFEVMGFMLLHDKMIFVNGQEGES